MLSNTWSWGKEGGKILVWKILRFKTENSPFLLVLLEYQMNNDGINSNFGRPQKPFIVSRTSLLYDNHYTRTTCATSVRPWPPQAIATAISRFKLVEWTSGLSCFKCSATLITATKLNYKIPIPPGHALHQNQNLSRKNPRQKEKCIKK